MPPFQSRSTGASRIAFISSAGVSAVTSAPSPSTLRACAETGIDFAERGHTPPPSEISEES